MNPAEFLLDLMNVDFSHSVGTDDSHLISLQSGWKQSSLATSTTTDIQDIEELPSVTMKHSKPTFFPILWTLVHRSFVKSYRDVVAYGIRVAMYTGT